jgi:pimeloyl-ACP methyl ester carboxylesterase
MSAQRGPGAVAEAMLPRLLGQTTRRERPDLVASVRALVESNSAGGIGDAIRALMSRPDSSSTLAGLRFPVHLVVGSEDELTPVPVHEQMRSASQASELTIVDGAGHLSNMEQPAAFNRALEHFLAASE